MPSHHDVSVSEPVDHGLNPLKPQAKINISSSRWSSILVKVTKSWLMQGLLSFVLGRCWWNTVLQDIIAPQVVKWGPIQGVAQDVWDKFGKLFSFSFPHLIFYQIVWCQPCCNLIFFKISMFNCVFFTLYFGDSLVKTFPLMKLLVKIF